MPYRENLQAHANELLPDGEHYVAGFLAKVRPPQPGWLKTRVVIVSNRRIHVFLAGYFVSWRPMVLEKSMSFGEALTYRRSPLSYQVDFGDQRLTVALFHHNALEESRIASLQFAAAEVA